MLKELSPNETDDCRSRGIADQSEVEDLQGDKKRDCLKGRGLYCPGKSTKSW